MSGDTEADPRWADIRSRIARASAALAETFEPSPEHTRTILAERARLIANRLVAPDLREQGTEYVVFSAANEHYAIEAQHVLSIVPLGETTAIPGAPGRFAGLMNLRGEILPIVDLLRFLDAARTGGEKAPWVLVLGGEHPEFGVAIARTVEVRTIRDEDIFGSAPAAADQAACRRGVTKDAVTVLDGAALLGDRRLFINDAPAQPAGG